MTEQPEQPSKKDTSLPNTDAKSVKPKRTGVSIKAGFGIVKTTKPKAKSGRRGRSKYGNKGCYVDDHFFHSQAESFRYLQLKEMVEQEIISDLELQPAFPIVINNIHICKYLADFRYKVLDDLGNTVRVAVEDVKGMVTDVYKLKSKMVMATHDVVIIEIPASKVAKWAGRPAEIE